MTSSGTSPLTVRFRGVRGSIPSPGMDTARYGGNTACVELRVGEEILILDAGSGIRALGNAFLKEFGARRIEANLLISHTHWDHIQGLPFFAPLYSARNRIRIIGANHGSRTLERGLRNQMQSMHFPVGLDEMRGLAGIEELSSHDDRIGAFSVATTSLNHPGGCTGFRIEAGGSTIAYLPDHEPFQNCSLSVGTTDARSRRKALVDFVHGVDLLILDTQYTEQEYLLHVGWGHGSLPESVALAIDAQVQRLAFFHHDPLHRDDQIDEMVVEARRLARSSPLQVEGAAENQTISFGARSDFSLESVRVAVG